MPFLATIQWQDVVDILLNSYVLFRLYVLFRGTNAFRVFMGITILWFSQKLAVSVGLVLTSWVIQAITAAAALIIIVVFRHEIRSVLQTRNLKAILWGFPHKGLETPVDVLVESVWTLGEQRIGALIVIPGREELSQHLHSGIPTDCLMSQEMLTSIFRPDNAVHDGAVIIQGNRIKDVSAILPVSQRTDVPSYYGTRHRAALGLTETTDALVIVVSEERGTTAAVKESRVKTVHTKKELEKAIQKHLQTGFQERGFLKRERTEMNLAALACLCFITIVWFSFTRGDDTLISYEIPIEYMNRARFEYLDTEVHAVRVQLSGPGALLKSIPPGQLKARVDLSTGAVGLNRFPIEEDTINLPPGVVLRKVAPSSVQATLDVAAEKELPVQVDWEGRLPEGITIESVSVIPARVKVMGESLLLKEIPTLYTKKIKVDDINESGKMTVRPALQPEKFRLKPGTTDSVIVHYTVKRTNK